MTSLDETSVNDTPQTRIVDLVRLNYNRDGIMYTSVTKEPEDQVATQKLVTKAIGEMTRGKKIPMLVEYGEVILPSLESREYWADENNAPYSLAEAYVMPSLPMKLIGNFYLNFNKPARPTRIFTKRDAAIKWLRQFV